MGAFWRGSCWKKFKVDVKVGSRWPLDPSTRRWKCTLASISVTDQGCWQLDLVRVMQLANPPPPQEQQGDELMIVYMYLPM